MGYPMMAPQPQIITAPYSVPPPPPPPPPPQPTANDAMVPVLMAETRQQQGEIRMSVSKLSDKIDELSNKVRQGGSSVLVVIILPWTEANIQFDAGNFKCQCILSQWPYDFVSHGGNVCWAIPIVFEQ